MTVETPATAPGIMLRNMRHALSLGLREIEGCRPHAHTLCVAGGGPSLADTCQDMRGFVAAINGSQKFLTDRGILDPGPHMPDVITADPRVRYYVASICDPGVFAKLRGCDVRLWHPTAVCGGQGLLELERPDGWLQVGGGSTMGMRWIFLGYMLGFRTFHLHGLDSSFRGEATHAYPDRVRGGQILKVHGRLTRRNFVEQVNDFFDMLDIFARPDVEPTEFKVFGDGLLQDRYRAWQRDKKMERWPRWLRDLVAA